MTISIVNSTFMMFSMMAIAEFLPDVSGASGSTEAIATQLSRMRTSTNSSKSCTASLRPWALLPTKGYDHKTRIHACDLGVLGHQTSPAVVREAAECE